MEFLLLAGLAYAGHALQRSAQTKPASSAAPLAAALPPVQPAPPTDSARFLSQQKAAAARWARDAGVVTSATVRSDDVPLPFFKNKGLTLNATQSQRRMEDLTGTFGAGSADNTWRHKSEARAAFEPTPQQIDSSGSQGNPAQDRRMPFVSALQNNVSAAPRVQVGPGMGVGTDVAAAGGFGGAYRPKVTNVNGYRVSRGVPGRVNAPGASNEAIATDPGELANRAPPRVYEMARRPLVRGSGMASVAAAKAGETFTSGVSGCKFPSNAATEDFLLTGPAGTATPAHALGVSDDRKGPYAYTDERNKNDAHGGTVLGPSTGIPAAGGYAHFAGTHDMARIYKTMRETRNGGEAFGTAASAVPAPRAAEQVVDQPTSREQLLEGYSGNPAHANGLAVRQQDGLQGTIREQTGGDQASLLGVAAGGAWHGTTGARVQCTDKQMDRLAKRGEEGQLLEGYVYGPENNASMCLANGGGGDGGGLGYVGLADKTVEARAGIVGSVVGALTKLPCTTARTYEHGNPRASAADLSVATSQLSGNYLNRSILA